MKRFVHISSPSIGHRPLRRKECSGESRPRAGDGGGGLLLLYAKSARHLERALLLTGGGGGDAPGPSPGSATGIYRGNQDAD